MAARGQKLSLPEREDLISQWQVRLRKAQISNNFFEMKMYKAFIDNDYEQFAAPTDCSEFLIHEHGHGKTGMQTRRAPAMP